MVEGRGEKGGVTVPRDCTPPKRGISSAARKTQLRTRGVQKTRGLGQSVHWSCPDKVPTLDLVGNDLCPSCMSVCTARALNLEVFTLSFSLAQSPDSANRGTAEKRDVCTQIYQALTTMGHGKRSGRKGSVVMTGLC